MNRRCRWRVVAIALLCAAALVPMALAEGPCTLPSGKKLFEKRTITLPGGAELTLAWIGKGLLSVREEYDELCFYTYFGGEEEFNEAEKSRHSADEKPSAFYSPDKVPVKIISKERIRAQVEGFWIGVCEVTQKQWESVMGSNPSYFRGEELSVASLRAELPVESVSWEDCAEFCRRTGLRLPLETEWLLANGAIGRWNTQSWRAKNSDNRTHPVGRSRSNESGIFDMGGNVSEWCADWYAPWPATPATNYVSPATGTAHVVWGGCWCTPEHFDRSLCEERLFLPPDCRYNNVGFRVCLTPSAAE